MRALSPLLLALACSSSPDLQEPSSRSIELRWLRGHPEDSWDQARAGLWWSMSQLGATPPEDESALVVEQWSTDTVRFRLELESLGMDESALLPLRDVVAELEDSDPYQRLGSADLGRFLMRLLYEPWRYYAMTGACDSLESWEQTRLSPSPAVFDITESMLIEGHRRIRFRADAMTMADIAWMAEEGDGSLETGDFEAQTFEVVDVMSNGQPRYALYDSSGALIVAPERADSPVGQPGRCMWCHEQHLMGTIEQIELEDSISWEEFSAQIETQQALIDQTRTADQSATDFTNPAVHTWSEQLVETFLYPSPTRVALEWELSLEAVEALVESVPLSTHISDEYPDFGRLLTRAEVDSASAQALGLEDYRPLATLPSSRDLDLGQDIPHGSATLVGGCAP